MSNKQIKILRSIKKYKCFCVILKKCGYTPNEYIEFQENFPDGSGKYMMFSDHQFDKNTIVVLTPYAESIIDEESKIRIRFWLPLIVSVCAFGISGAAFIKSFFG